MPGDVSLSHAGALASRQETGPGTSERASPARDDEAMEVQRPAGESRMNIRQVPCSNQIDDESTIKVQAAGLSSYTWRLAVRRVTRPGSGENRIPGSKRALGNSAAFMPAHPCHPSSALPMLPAGNHLNAGQRRREQAKAVEKTVFGRWQSGNSSLLLAPSAQ